NDNRNFNRATALRQFGSTWKPLVYHAALSLGWSPDDPLDNSRNVFPFSTTFYYPSPDHHPAPVVSMAWAGVNSENVASIWLLYHLTDPLDGEQVRRLAQQLDLARRTDETAESYRTRIQKLGVLPTKDRMKEGLFLQSRQEVVSGLSVSAHPEDELALRSLLYGWGFASERVRAGRDGPSTRAWKDRALSNDWQTLSERMSGCSFQYGALADAMADGRLPDPEVVHDLSGLLDGDVIRLACGAIPEGYVVVDASFIESVRPPPAPTVVRPLFPEPVEVPRPRRRLFGRDPVGTEPAEDDLPTVVAGPQLAPLADLLVDDRLHASTITALSDAMTRRELTLQTAEDPPDLYSPEVLYWHQDFRVLLAMRYVASLAEDFGVATEIREVLAMPLGASEITLEEAVSMYEGLTTGRAWQFPGHAGRTRTEPIQTSTLLIAEIRDVDGRVLYQAEPAATRITDPVVGGMTDDILRNVVLYGTGRRASSAIRLGGSVVPVGGKTGTTNDFRNAAFVGYAPRATPEGFVVEGGFTVGAYVGYDDNRSMSAGRIRIAGASGALPAWIGTLQGLAAGGLLGDAPTVAPVGGVWPLVQPARTSQVTVDAKVGLPATGEGTATVLVREAWDASLPDLAVQRIERPPRIAPNTEDALLLGTPSEE
ncbi:MAG: hypothetical protein KC621_34440, partial [Myxococcales bacterium]|nr:hypothetical protein [Myxococcales bacterium]